jgi:hypothetical protein
METPARITLGGVALEFRSGGEPAGLHLRAREVRARSRRLLGLGPAELTLVGAEAEIDCSAADLMRLDFLAGAGGESRVGRVVVEDAGVFFSGWGGDYRLRGIDWAVEFAPEGVEVKATAEPLRIEGPASRGLGEESPKVSLALQVSGRRLVVRDLEATGESGWGLGGDMEVDLGEEPARLSGGFKLWRLPVSLIYTPPAGVDISPGAHVERKIAFTGPVDRLLVEVTTDVKGLDYADGKLGLRAEGVTLSGLKSAGEYDLTALVRSFVPGE